ncbi:hypothetical protein NDU88_001351 [Pleurodeles waltl]|uniref:Uncharacterized protein n=1 Tax=Pleurodeles waltl TaxID=8319 RepID=A0AAV7LXM7_PLEWA|nr:hypothetical protein NDU88_001351 [Pleurodeles waltl]
MLSLALARNPVQSSQQAVMRAVCDVRKPIVAFVAVRARERGQSERTKSFVYGTSGRPLVPSCCLPKRKQCPGERCPPEVPLRQGQARSRKHPVDTLHTRGGHGEGHASSCPSLGHKWVCGTNNGARRLVSWPRCPFSQRQGRLCEGARDSCVGPGLAADGWRGRCLPQLAGCPPRVMLVTHFTGVAAPRTPPQEEMLGSLGCRPLISNTRPSTQYTTCFIGKPCRRSTAKLRTWLQPLKTSASCRVLV